MSGLVKRAEVSRFVLGYLRADWLRVTLCCTGMLGHVVLTVASTQLIGGLVETGEGLDLVRLGGGLGEIMLALVAAVVLRWFADRAVNVHTAEAVAAITATGYAKVQSFETAWHADNFAGSTARKITRAAQGYDMYVSCWYFFFLPSILLVLVTAGTIGGDSPAAAGAMLVGSLVYFLAITWFNRAKVMPLMQRAFAWDSRITGELVDALGNNAAVKSWATEPRELARLGRVVVTWRDYLVAAWDGAVNSDALQTTISAAILVAPIGITLLQVHLGQAHPRTVATVIGAGFVLRGWLGNIGRGVREAQNAISEMTEMVTLLGRASEAEEDAALGRFSPGPGAIRLENLSFRYGDAAVPVFDGLNLEIAAGQTVALVGPSGGGKSSFVKLLLGLYRPTGGRIFLDGQDVAGCTRASVRQAIALVPQDPALFHRTIAENIGYGAPGASEAEVIEAAKRARLHTMIEALPQGYQTFVGERGIKLSGGERQRVAIARALVAHRPVLIFDEATSSLDTANEQAIQQALHQAMAGRTTLIIAHRLSTVRHADRILVFDRGRIVEDGTHAELAKRPGGLYARLLSADAAEAA